MIILGFDPGTAITGYGVIETQQGRQRLLAYGTLRTSAQDEDAQRLLQLYEDALCILDRYQPDYIAVEQLFFNQNVTTAVPVGQARGVLLLACAQRNKPIAEYTPLQVKQTITGYGRADKRQMQYMVSRLLKIAAPKNDDAADALAIAITHAYHYRNRKMRGDDAL